MNPVGLPLRLPPSPSRHDNAPVETTHRAQEKTADEPQRVVLPVAQARAMGTQMEDQLRTFRGSVMHDTEADARTRRAIQSYTSLLNSGENELLSDMLGVDEYA